MRLQVFLIANFIALTVGECLTKSKLTFLVSTNKNQSSPLPNNSQYHDLNLINKQLKAYCGVIDSSFSLHFDFGSSKTIAVLDIQGYPIDRQMLSLYEFTLHFSSDNKQWYDCYEDHTVKEGVKVFEVQSILAALKSQIIQFELKQPVTARYMKLQPLMRDRENNLKICVNVVVRGCNKEILPTVKTQPTVTVAMRGESPAPVQLKCSATGLMNYTVGWNDSGKVTRIAPYPLPVFKILQATQTVNLRWEELDKYSCSNDIEHRKLLCEQRFVCQAKQLYSPFTVVEKSTKLVASIDLPSQLQRVWADGKTKTTSSVMIHWELTEQGGIPLRYLQINIRCKTKDLSMMQPIKIPASVKGSFKLDDLYTYTRYVCYVQLQTKPFLNVDIKQLEKTFGFVSKSKRPLVHPNITIKNIQARKVKLAVNANFSVDPTFGKITKAIVKATQLHYGMTKFSGPITRKKIRVEPHELPSFTLRQLVPWSLYNISVTLYNDDDLSSYTSWKNFTTAESRPTIAPTIKLTFRTSTTISLNIQVQESKDPLKLANGKITRYQYHYLPDNKTEEKKVNENLGESQFYGLESLKPNTVYLIRARMKTAVGWGPFSLFYSVRTEDDKPTEPTDIVAMESSEGNLVLSWNPPFQPNGNITHYEIQLILENRERVLKTAHSHTNFNTETPITEAYQVAIRAYTSKGSGSWSLALPVDQGSISPKDSDNKVLIISFSIVLIVLLILVFAGLVCYRRRNHPRHNESGKKPLVYPIYSRSDENEGLLVLHDMKQKSLSESTSCEQATTSLSHEPVPVESFSQYINRVKQDDYEQLIQEYKREPNGSCYPCTVANRPENRPKNRYQDIYAYDHSRVILKYDCKRKQADYINASYIQGYNPKSPANTYIATQGPLENTVQDFWHMVYQEHIQVIVMLTNLFENEKNKCNQYWPNEGSAQYGAITVTVGNIDKTADYVIRTFQITRAGHENTEPLTVRQFHFVSWPDHGSPEQPTALLSLRRRVRRYYLDFQIDSPLLVHCSAGVGRAGCFILIDSMLERIDNDGTVDIISYLQYLRSRRINMVQTPEQYIFAHEAILEYIVFGNTEIGLDDLDRRTRLLTKGTGMTDEFAVLNNNTQREQQSTNMYKVLLREGKFVDAYFIDGYKQRNSFILSLAPTEDKVGDFWKMVLQQQCHTIVMLNKTQETSQEYFKYWPDVDGHYSCDNLTVLLNSEVANGNIITRKIKVTTNKSRCEVHHYQYVDWPGGDVPHRRQYSNICTLMQSVEKSQQQLGNGPIFVHGGGEYGRSGTFVAIYNSTERLKVEQLVDVLQCVRKIRISQPRAVDNVAQYQFVYHLLRIYLEGFENYWNYKDYKVCKSPNNSTSTF